MNANEKWPAPPPGGGGTLIFSYIRRLRSYLRGQNFDFQYFLGFSEKYIFLGVMILWIFFGGHHKIGLYLGLSL